MTWMIIVLPLTWIVAGALLFAIHRDRMARRRSSSFQEILEVAIEDGLDAASGQTSRIAEVLFAAVQVHVDTFQLMIVALDEAAPALIGMARQMYAAVQGWEIRDGTVTEIGYREIDG